MSSLRNSECRNPLWRFRYILWHERSVRSLLEDNSVLGRSRITTWFFYLSERSETCDLIRGSLCEVNTVIVSTNNGNIVSTTSESVTVPESGHQEAVTRYVIPMLSISTGRPEYSDQDWTRPHEDRDGSSRSHGSRGRCSRPFTWWPTSSCQLRQYPVSVLMRTRINEQISHQTDLNYYLTTPDQLLCDCIFVTLVIVDNFCMYANEHICVFFVTMNVLA